MNSGNSITRGLEPSTPIGLRDHHVELVDHGLSLADLKDHGLTLADLDTLPGILDYTETRLEGAVEEIKAIGIVAAYRKWCGKSEPTGNRTESIMVSCPMPDHPDRNPSAWLNSDKGLWYCGACGFGGDIIDLVAISHGYSRSPRGADFVKVLEAGLTDLGIDPNTMRVEQPATEAKPVKVAPPPTPASTIRTSRILRAMALNGWVYLVPDEVVHLYWFDYERIGTCIVQAKGFGATGIFIHWTGNPELSDIFKPDHEVIMLADNDALGLEAATALYVALEPLVADLAVYLPPEPYVAVRDHLEASAATVEPGHELDGYTLWMGAR